MSRREVRLQARRAETDRRRLWNTPNGAKCGGSRGRRDLIGALRMAALLLLAGLLLASTAHAGPPPASFAQPAPYPLPSAAGSVHQRLAVGTLRSGQPDDVVVGDTHGDVDVYLNQGNGTLAHGVQYATGGASVSAVAIADVNGDHHADVIATVVGGYNGAGNGIYVFPGTGSGGLVAPYPVLNYDGGSGDSPTALAVGDLFHDGRTAIAVGYSPAGANGDTIRTFQNDGTGHFTLSGTIGVGNTYTSVSRLAAVDLTRDRVPDVVASVGGNGVTGCGGVQIYVNDGSGGFAGKGALPGLCSEEGTVGAGDFNHTGNIDLAAADPGGQVERVFYGAGDGTFGTSTSYQVPAGSPGNTTAADFNGDGWPDLLTSCRDSCSASMQVLLNNDDGSFTPGPTLSGDNDDLAAGHLTGSCFPDLAGVGYALTVLLNTQVGPCVTTGGPEQCARDVSLPSGVVAHAVGSACFQQLGSASSVSDDVAVNGIVFHRLDSSSAVTVDAAAQTLTSTGPLQIEAVASGSSGLLAGSAIPLETLAAPAKFDIAGAVANGLQFVPSGTVAGLPLASFGLYGHFGDQNTTDLSSVASLKLFGPSIDGALDLTTDNTQLLQLTSLHFDANGGANGGTSSSDSGGGSGTGRQPGKHYRVHSIYNCAKAPPPGFKCVPDRRVRFKGGGFLQRDDGEEPELGRGFPVRHVTIDYMAPFGSPQLGEWSGSGTVDLASIFPGTVKPIGGLPIVTLGLSFYSKPFRFSGGSGKLDNVSIPIGEFVFLNRLAANLHLPRPRSQDVQIGGGLGLSAAPKLGRFRALGVDGNFSYQHGRRSGFDINVSGTVSAAELTLAAGHIDYDARDSRGGSKASSKVSFGGQVGGTYGPSWATIAPQGNIDGEVTANHWEASGNVAVKAQLGPIGGGPTGTALVSDHGFGLCAHLDALFFHGQVGFVHKWGSDWRFFTCDFSGLQPLYTVHAAAAGASQPIRVSRNLRGIEVAVRGPAGPPSVTLVGPGGRRIVSPAQPDKLINGTGALTLAESASRTTYFLIDRPPAGVWRMIPAAREPGPLRVLIATPLPTSFHASARVTGNGRRRTLTWKLPRIPGIDYVLEESGQHVLARIGHPVASSGHIVIRPAAGPAGRRTILVLVERSGLPVTTIVAGHYTAPGTPFPAGPRSARYHLKGKTLMVSWRRVPRASGYVVTVTRPGKAASSTTWSANARRAVLQITSHRVRRITVSAILNGISSTATTARK